jgi:membrane associated rhomboid family serine protease
MIPISDSEKSRKFPIINLLLIAVNVIVFFLEITAPNPDAFITSYALIPASVDFGNVATLYPFITSMFLHGGLIHIASNMLFLWVFGDNVEGELNPFTYLLLYLGSGIIGSLGQYVMAATSPIPMLGASGAVAGVLGAYMLLFPNHRVRTLVLLPFFFTITEISAIFMIGYWIVLQLIAGIGVLGVEMGQTGGVAYFAHIAGFLAGIVFITILPKHKPEFEKVE